MKRILIPIDFTEGAEIAVEYGLAIAQKTNAEIHFLHILLTPIEWKDLPVEKENLYPETKVAIGRAKDALNKLEIRVNALGIKTSSKLAFNQNRENLVERANSGDYDLIIMGSYGASGLRKFTIGSNALGVIRNAKTPVLVVKNRPVSFLPEKIVFASTFEDNQKPILKTLQTFSRGLGAQLDLLHINTPYRFFETIEMDKKMFGFIEGIDESINIHSYNALNEEKGVNDFTENTEVDILAIATTGKSSLTQLFKPSLTEDLVNSLDIPVLSIHVNA